MAPKKATKKPSKTSKDIPYQPKLKQLKLTAFFTRANTNINNSTNTSLDSSSTSTVAYKTEQDNLVDKAEQPPTIVTIEDSSEEDTIDCSPSSSSCDIKILEHAINVVDPNAKKRKYTKDDFVEFEDFNYNVKVNAKRKTPFYKKIPYTRIVVDAFNFPKEPDIQHYVLSHFHADHYVGLCKSFDKPIYCSPITGRLVKFKFKVSGKYINQHELNEPFRIENAVCTFYEANHCPGAVIILFELDNGHRYLHTGDFRACPEMERIPNMRPVDACFLDTTFCDKSKTFPPQKDVLIDCVSVCKYALEKNSKTLIVCGSYCIGKEKVFLAVAEALNLKVWCSKAKKDLYACVQDPRISAVLVESQFEANLHVLPLKMLWRKGLKKYLGSFEHLDAIVALRPSGWEYKRNKHMIPETEGNVAIYPVPYSEHSSYDDLERFIRWLRPRRIIPTVNMGEPEKRGKMNHIFNYWLHEKIVGVR